MEKRDSQSGTSLAMYRAQPSPAFFGMCLQTGRDFGNSTHEIIARHCKDLIPGREYPYRLYGDHGLALMDAKVPYALKRVNVTATKVTPLSYIGFGSGQVDLSEETQVLDRM